MKKREFIICLISLLILYGVALNFFGFIRGNSMNPNFPSVGFALFNPLETNYKRFDVVSARDPINNVRVYKRIVGLPGELLKIENGILFINGIRIENPYTNWEDENIHDTDRILEDDEYFLLGDNQPHSNDSLNGRLRFKEKNIKAKLLFVFKLVD